MTGPENTTVVVGLDGAHFELLEPWIEDGLLPNIRDCITDGVSGDLKSVLPPVTSPNWKCYSTGRNPGKIGIFWWENINVDQRDIYYPESRKNALPHYWERIAETHDVGVVGVPLTYPPREFNGNLVAGAPDGREVNYTTPQNLQGKLEEEFNYRVSKRNRIDTDREAAVEEILDLIDLRFKIGKFMLSKRDVDFLQVTTFYINSLHHFLWDDEATLRAWQLVDEYVGEFRDCGYNVILMSDHGSTTIDQEFHVNAWLQQEGYLETNMRLPSVLHRAGITTDRLIELATTLGVQRVVKKLTPNAILQYIPNEDREISRNRKAGHVNWEDTKAIASGQGPVYLNVERTNPEYDSIRDGLIKKLRHLEGPSGQPVAKSVHRGESIYDGRFVSDAPDIVIDQTDGTHISGRIGRSEVFTTPERGEWKAENKRSGLFIAAGPEFATGGVDMLSILDLAPTLLHLFGQPIPEEYDGSVQSEVFHSNSEAIDRKVKYSVEPRKSHDDKLRRIARRSDL